MVKESSTLKQVRKFEKELEDLIEKHKHLHAALIVGSCVSIATGIALECAPSKENALKVINEIIKEAVESRQQHEVGEAISKIAEDGKKMREHQKTCTGCAYCD